MRRAVLLVLVGCAVIPPPDSSAATEAARLHNVGVAQEALAYKLPMDSPDHRRHLEQAAEAYRKAHDLDRGEKYFAEPIQSVETSMVYARASVALDSGRGKVLHLDGIGYEDEGGKPRVATLEVSLGEGPGGWSPWKGDLGALRPRPVHVTEVKVLVEGGTVRVDNLAVRER